MDPSSLPSTSNLTPSKAGGKRNAAASSPPSDKHRSSSTKKSRNSSKGAKRAKNVHNNNHGHRRRRRQDDDDEGDDDSDDDSENFLVDTDTEYTATKLRPQKDKSVKKIKAERKTSTASVVVKDEPVEDMAMGSTDDDDDDDGSEYLLDIKEERRESTAATGAVGVANGWDELRAENLGMQVQDGVLARGVSVGM